MNHEQAFGFLRSRPEVSEENMNSWLRTIEFLTQNPREIYIPFLIEAFGRGNQIDIQSRLQLVLRRFAATALAPYLKTGLFNDNPSVRQWCADTVQFFPHIQFLPGLREMLREELPLSRYESAVAMEQIQGEEVRRIAASALVEETDDDVREVLSKIIETD